MKILEKIKLINIQKTLFILIFSIFLFLVFYGFPDSPSPWFDEGVNLGIAKTFSQEGVYNLTVGPNEYVNNKYLMMTTNYPLLSIVAFAFKLFGSGIWQAKIVMSIFLIVFAILFFQVVKKYYGKNYALMSLALLTVFLPLYGNGKGVLGEIPGLVYFLGGLLLIDKNKWWQIFLAGLLFGLGAATKPLYLLLILAIIISEVWSAIRNKGVDYKRWLWLGLGGFLPLFIWIVTILPDSLSAGLISEILNYYRNPYNIQQGGMMVKNFIRFFSESTPLHFMLFLSVALVSKAMKRNFQKGELVIFLFIIFSLVFYLKTAGWYRYFFPAHILLFILFPYALSVIFQKISFEKFKKYGVATIVVLLFSIQSIHLVLNINKKLYYNPQPRQFAERVNQIMSNDKDVWVIQNPSTAFFLEKGKIFQYLTINPYLIVGKDLFDRSGEPDYIITEENNEVYAYLADELKIKYKEILRSGKLVLLGH